MASMFTGVQSSATSLFSAYASFAGTMMVLRTVANDVIPHQLRTYIWSLISPFIPRRPNLFTIVVEETCGFSQNQLYQAAELYLPTKINPSTQRIKVGKVERQKNLTVSLEKGEKIKDVYDGVDITWTYVFSSGDDNKKKEESFFEVKFDKKHREKVLSSYLPHVLARAKEIKDQEKVVKLYSRDCDRDAGGKGGRGWGSINLEHPATFDKLAMDEGLKKEIIDDLDRFVKRREFYKKVGKAWKRGYLLYGPPGTGKSSLIACMANYLKFDIYDVELSSLLSNRDFKRVLLGTSNRSIVVIEDIDCSLEAQDRRYMQPKIHGPEREPNPKLTLSGLLNFIDGLWSSCGDERIIVFTTNHKDRLDPALLRPGRMDMHINLSYCTPCGFRILASNYLDVKGENRLCEEIERLIEEINVTPAEVAEELMRSDDPEVALRGLIECLKRKKIESETVKHQPENDVAKVKDDDRIGSDKEMTLPEMRLPKMRFPEITYAI